ncbi:E3 ubiquitin-protein ligase ORTHRUS [Salix suchowensis]|nr:E3 ubiquitin-protein ligase ORTHRUS [Salix suchowensis]
MELPCDGAGICMACKNKPPDEETLNCKTCATPWHATCLVSPPQELSDTLQWEIEDDKSLTEQEKAKKRQELLSGAAAGPSTSDCEEKKEKNDVLDILDKELTCSFCMQMLDRPVTTPCGHNFCLKCFQRWIGQGKRTCAYCRVQIPPKMASQPRINSTLVIAIRMARMSRSSIAGGAPKVYHFVHNQNRPDKAYTTELPPDHFGPIPAENDPERNMGVLVGEIWEDRLACRQWGAHLPHVAGIAGQSTHGSQSVALSGGYIDDEDHGEWFLYTGSGGRDLSGNKRTNKDQSFDQNFDKMNEALRVSCLKGYPVRVVRSHKEKRSSYAPETGVRYDGVYRIEKCWRKNGIQGFKVCRYLFVRCDNDPAPWTSDVQGDRPRPLPVIKELKNAIDITERKGSPSWDYDLLDVEKPPPVSKKRVADGVDPEDGKVIRTIKRQRQNVSVREKLLKEFSCQICRKVMVCPITTPCAHNFCKACLEAAFAGQSYTRQRGQGRRSLRVQKNVMKCPSCIIDIAEFIQNPQVNREMMGVIESLQRQAEEEKVDENSEGCSEEAIEQPDLIGDAVNDPIAEEPKDESQKAEA